MRVQSLGAVTEVGGLRDVDEALTGGLLAVGLDRVLEVAEEDVDGADHPRDLRGHLLVARVEEVDHPAGAGGDLTHRRRGADRERAEEVLG